MKSKSNMMRLNTLWLEPTIAPRRPDFVHDRQKYPGYREAFFISARRGFNMGNIT